MRSLFALVVLLACSSAAAYTAPVPASRACASRISTVSMGPQDYKGKKFGVPIFLPNGNVNPAYLAKERKIEAASKKKNFAKFEKLKAKQVAKKTFELGDVIKKKVGSVTPPGYFPGKGGK